MAIATSSASLPSAEASSHRLYYDVFLSFRGVDTREGITSAIYAGLEELKEIKTFIDGCNVEVGDSISPTLLKAIKESRFAIVILSQHYADSTWCLEELATIFQCMKNKNRILPLFYQVNPSDVRYQNGSYKDAFQKHESRHDIEKVKQWKDALHYVANLSGWDSGNYWSDKELVDDIVKIVRSKVLQVNIEDESTSRDFEEFKATKLAMNKVMKGLQDDDVAVMGLYGVGGVGKTTLVKHACVQAREIGLFNKVIMAVVSQSLNLKHIQAQLANMLALNFGKVTEEDRAVELQEAILRGNKLLIILDDMWSEVPLASIGIPSNKELQKCKSKVLFTTRGREVCEKMNSDAKINLNVLSKEDSLKLFMKKARMTFQESTEIYSVAKEMARDCAGVPVALIAVAKALRDEVLDEWKKAAKRLQESQLADLENKMHIFNCIKLSYDHLKSTDAKSCLLLCCLFPEDYDIPIEDLFRYGIGKGLFQESNTLQEARATADLVVKSLKESDLLLDSEKNGCIKLHDVIRDVVTSISLSEDGQRMFVKSGRDVTEWPNINADISYSAISVMDTQIRYLPEELVVCSKLLQILSLNNAQIYSIPDTFLQSQTELRILDLRDNYMNALPDQSLGLLINLRALFMHGNFLPTNFLSFLKKLENLEIFSLTDHGFHLPKQLEELPKLRMLDIRNPKYNRLPTQVISRLMNLEELYIKDKIIWGPNGLCCDEFIRLSKLNILEVQIHDAGYLPKVVEFNPHWVKFDITFNANHSIDYLAKLPLYESQKSLCLATSINNLPDWFNKVVTERAEKLVYYWFRGMTNILEEHGAGRLHAVKSLAVIKHAHILPFMWRQLMKAVKWDDPEKPVFDKLEELYVEDVPCVELCVGELPLGSFCNLKKFKVLDCSNMKNALLSSNLLRILQNLEEVLCADLSDLQYVFGTDEMEPEQIICTKLRKIHLRNLPKLINICNGPTPHAIFQNLKSLKISNCGSLEYVFPSRSVVEFLVHLEELYVYSCPKLVTVIRGNDYADYSKDIEFPELKIVFLVDLIRLEGFCRPMFCGISIIGNRRPIINCPKLEQIHVSNGLGFYSSDREDVFSTFQSLNEVHLGSYSEHYSVIKRMHKESSGRRTVPTTAHW